MWEVVTLGGTPYADLLPDDLYTQLISEMRLPKPQHCAQPVYDVMNLCWQTIPNHRPLFDEIYEHLNNLNMSKMVIYEYISHSCTLIFIFYLSIHFVIYLRLSIYLPIYISIYPSIYISMYLTMILCIYLSICLSIYLLNLSFVIHPSIYLSTYLLILSIYLFIYLSVYLTTYISIPLELFGPTKL